MTSDEGRGLEVKLAVSGEQSSSRFQVSGFRGMSVSSDECRGKTNLFSTFDSQLVEVVLVNI